MLTENADSSKADNRLFIILLLVMCLLVAAVYWPCLSAKALCFDDNQYLLDNVLVRNPSPNAAWRFLTEVFKTSTVAGYYQPFAMISLMLDSAMGGTPNNLYPFHRTSLILHLLNTGLIALILYLLFRRPWVACGVALFFGLHPLTIEPIAWVGERKTALAALFAFGCLAAYVHYAQKGGRWRYALCLLLYFFSLMSKPTGTPLPAVLILLDFWPLKRLSWKSMLEKIPFFVIAGIGAYVTIVSQGNTASVMLPHAYGGAIRVPLIFGHNIIFYLQKMILPFGLSPHWAFPVPLSLANPTIVAYCIGSIVLIAVLVASLRWTRAPITGWLIFFIMVLPTMQALQFSDVIASSKFAYLPSIGVLLVIAWALTRMWGQEDAPGLTPRRKGVIALILVLAAGEAVDTRWQLGYWKDSERLYTHMAQIRPNAISPYNNLAVLYGESKRYDESLLNLRKVLELDPNDTAGNFNMGRLAQEQGRIDEALTYFKKVLTLPLARPEELADAYSAIGGILVKRGEVAEGIEMYIKGIERCPYQRYIRRDFGMVLYNQGRLDDAIKELTIATQLLPDSGAHANLGLALAEKGDIENGMKHLKIAIRLDETNSEARYDLGNAYLMQNKLDDAIRLYREAIALKPGYAKAHGNLAIALAQKGDTDAAISQFREVLRILPDDVGARYNLARAMVDKGLVDEAVGEFRQVLRLDPNDVDAYCTLGDVLAQQGKRDMALEEYKKASKIAPDYPRVQAGLKKLSESEKAPQPGAGSK